MNKEQTDELLKNRDSVKGSFVLWDLSWHQLVELYKQGERDFSQAKISQKNDPSGNLYAKNLYFDQCNFNSATFEKCHFSNITFKNCHMQGVKFEAGSRFYDCSFEESTIYFELENCILNGCSFDKCKSDWLTIKYSNLANCTFMNAELPITVLLHNQLVKVQFDNSHMLLSQFMYNELNFVTFKNADLRGSEFWHNEQNDIDFENANICGMQGLYLSYAYNLSSRNDTLYGGVNINNGKIELCFWTGCVGPVKSKELKKRIIKKHSENIHAVQYFLAVESITQMFQIDMDNHKWDYLLNMQPHIED